MLKSQDGVAEVTMEHLRFRSETPGGAVFVEDVFTPCSLDERGRELSRCLFRKPYDHVISAPVGVLIVQIFDRDVFPALHANGKHPALRSGTYESANVSGLYFVGSAAHAHDYKVSSGGFIHGFRHLARALYRQFEERELEEAKLVVSESVVLSNGTTNRALDLKGVYPAPWPRTELRCGLRGLVAAILRRINLAAGPFQLFGGLADVFLTPCDLTEADVSGFSGVGPLAALYDEVSFPYPDERCIADAVSDSFSTSWSTPNPRVSPSNCI